jgi:hypothetical protein
VQCEHVFTGEPDECIDVDTRLGVALAIEAFLDRPICCNIFSSSDPLLSQTMLFASAPQRKKRSPAFAGSVFLHGALASLLALKPLAATVSEPTPGRITRKYSVVLLRFQPPPADREHLAALKHDTPRAESEQTLSANPESNVRRRFELPPHVQVRPVKQTLVQLDVPPDVVLKQPIPLPTALLWTSSRFVAPPLNEIPRERVNLPTKPTLEPPNAEITVADLRVAAALLNELPQLPRPASTTSPVRSAGPQQANETPQTLSEFPSQTTVAVNVISLPENPVSSTTVVVVPPANQIAPSGGASGQQETPPASTGPAPESEPRASASGLHDTSDDDTLPGTTRITLPKDGKFSAVVLASAASSPYSESEGALSAKVIRTVYLQMGLRKSWILQYCLPNGAEQNNNVKGSTTSLEAPWPFLMIRPNELNNSDADYVVVHGIVTAEGRFDQLALVFPEDLAQKNLLMSSLKRWEFRPASQAEQNLAVEVLLIIPRESE